MKIRVRKIYTGKNEYLEIPDKALEENGSLTIDPKIHVNYVSKDKNSDVTVVVDSDFKIVGTSVLKKETHVPIL